MNTNWRNRTLFHGDNLEVMRAMNSESVDLIATDPPFNKGKDFHATPDSLAAGASFQDRWTWERDVHQEWVDQITDDFPKLMEAIESARYAHSDGMGAFMCFMAVRLLAMHRLLKPTGSIYLHCDPTASHYLKAVMDAIFGSKNFRNEIIWCYSNAGRAKRGFAKKHDIILFYSKTKDFYWSDYRIPISDKSLAPYRHIDGEGRRYREGTWPSGKKYRYYAEEGMICNDWWEIPSLSSRAKERIGYPTQKPIALYERIIQASSNKGDVVLDPFCGCATTPVAAEKLGRQWVGIDLWNKAHEVVVDRLKQEVGLLGDVIYTDQLPKRTDGGRLASPFLRVKERVKEPEGPTLSRAKMYEFLLEQEGPKCQGCDRTFDDKRYLELDHNTPRSDGGLNHLSNRILLCGPCNRLKSNTFTLTGLRKENKKRGYMR